MSSVDYVEYRVNNKEILLADYVEGSQGTQFTFPIHPEDYGYSVVEFWVYDLAGNKTYYAFWYWVEDGSILSTQLYNDGKMYLRMRSPSYKVNPLPEKYECRLCTAPYTLDKLINIDI